MKKIIVLMLFFLLIGCSQQKPEDCLDSFCVDSIEYGINGTLSILDIDRGTVKLSTSLTDEKNQLRNVEIEIFSKEWDFIYSEKGQHLITSSSEVLFRALRPNTDYIAVMRGTIVVDGEFISIGITYVEFTTTEFEPVDISGLIDNIRVGNSFVIYDFQLLSHDYYIVTYGVFLYEGDRKLDEFTAWGSRELTTVTNNNQVFDNLDSNTTYILKLTVIYELETMQNSATIDEITFTTN